MKRCLLSVLVVVIGLSAFSQSPSRLFNLQPAYPLTIGESASEEIGLVFSSHTLSAHDIVLDTLPRYEIGYIDEQTVRYSETGYGFYVKADSLHSLNVVYNYEVHELPQGGIDFDAKTGRFKYYPTADDYQPFAVTFSATNGTDTLSEEVVFNLMPQMPSEVDLFHSRGVLPDAGDYTTVAETSATKYLNNQERTAYNVSIAGKDVVFDDAIQNKVWGMSGREDIEELNIYAERLIIRSALKFPQTNITIYAKELIFEDRNGVVASINTTPRPIGTLSDNAGANGANAGNITLYVGSVKGDAGKRLIACGAAGQSTNRNGTPGAGGDGGAILANVDMGHFCDFARGCGGVKYDVAADGSTTAGDVIGRGAVGRDGYYVSLNQPYAYLHPYYIAAVMRHANDAFINNCTEEVLATCREYRALISEAIGTFGVNEGIIGILDNVLGVKGAHEGYIDSSTPIEMDENELALYNSLIEIESMLFRLEQGLDYFGNPEGWVPLLSFEVYLENYKNEIDRAIPTLYMYY
ncbi:MAG: hypothetical protein IJ767_03615 [Bacteroidaceae bacterium]|nr:hypothetical protein [Bacteroidaceae bacterium]